MNDFKLVQGFIDGMQPEPNLTVSEWAEKYRYLSSEASFMGGQLYSCKITPFARKIMDSLSAYSTYHKVVFCKGVQSGGTELGNNWLGYIMHINPGPTLMLMPTDGTVERNSKIRIDPMIEHCPELKIRVAEKKSRDGDNTINQKKFPYGVLYMGGANSPAVLKSIPVKNVFLDEIDEYPLDLGGQGSAIDLAEVRTQMWPNYKILAVSTPTVLGTSQIWSLFETTDQNYYNVPCPHCGSMQKLIFENLKWTYDKPKSVVYECCHCGNTFDESHKYEIMQVGDWVPENKAAISDDTIGFHINALYAHVDFYPWFKIVEKFIKAEKDPIKMKTFLNTQCGLPSVEKSDAPKWQNLYNRREDYPQNFVSNDVCFLTAGVDVQKDRLELEIVGWGKDKTSWSIDYRVLLGKTVLPDVWDELGKVVYETWEREDGTIMDLKLMAVDSGWNTTEVYDFCRKYPYTKVIPTKGQDRLGIAVAPPKQIDYNRKGKKIGKTKIWNIGVSQLKHELYAWLGELEAKEGKYPPCYCHFPQYSESYFEGLTAEDWIPVKKQWRKRYERNEPLDCRIYARAAAIVVGLDRMKPEQIEAIYGKRIKEIKAEKPKIRKVKNSIWD